MCLTAPARVLATDGEVALVELDGRRRRASLAVVPDAAPGDWVIVGAGTILRRLDPEEARSISLAVHAARGTTQNALDITPNALDITPHALDLEGESR